MLLPPSLRLTRVLLCDYKTFASCLSPTFVKQFLLRSSSANLVLLLMILQMTCTAWSPKAISAKLSFLVPASAWFFTTMSKNLSICCFDVLMTKS